MNSFDALKPLVYKCDRLTAVLSRKSKYGLKALLVLAQEAGRGPVLIAELADRDAIPKKFLEAILLELKRHGVVQSQKGKGGGYFLRRATGRDHLRRGDSRAGRAAGGRALCQSDGVHEVRRVRR